MITFEKVPIEHFINDTKASGLLIPELYSNFDFMLESYSRLSMPERATAGSAGYDIHTPFAFTLRPGHSMTIPTGIRCVMPTGFVLLLFPRSGLGFKYGLRLENSVGIIDADFCNADNCGDIMVKLHNPSDKIIRFERDDKICQGIITKYFTVDDDNAIAERHGGFGSTDETS